MSGTLGFESLTNEQINTSYGSLLSALNNADTSIQLSIANSLWANNKIQFKADFIEQAKKYYGAEVSSLNFADAGTLSEINGWVSEQTHGKIKSIVDKIEENDILYLLNAIYFKGNWSKIFDKRFTNEQNFKLLSNKTKLLPLMYQSGRYQYLRGENFQAVSLPYGNGRISMYVVLPDSNVEYKDFYQHQFISRHWETWTSEFHGMEGNIRLPRFKLENNFQLNGELQSLGMEVAFDWQHANFRNMCQLGKEDNIYISKVTHKTFVEVNEEGTEAAAATLVSMGHYTAAISHPEPIFSMIVNRPFFCVVRDNQTGMILFMGSIVDPNSNAVAIGH
jgi:serpin B